MAVLKYYNTATSAWEYIAASTTANFTTWKKTMAGGETSVSGTDDNAVTLSYTVGLEQVFINGVLQVRGSDYTATTGTSVTGLSTLAVNDVVTVVCYAPFNVTNTYTKSETDSLVGAAPGTRLVVPTSVAVGSGSGSVDTNGAVTFSGASSVSLNGCFSSTYQNYRIIFNMSNGQGSVTMKLRASGTDTATNYKTYTLYGVSGTMYQSAVDALGTDEWYLFDVDTTIDASGNGYVDINNPNVAIDTSIVSHNVGGSGATMYWYSDFGRQASATQFDGFTITGSLSTNLTGTIRVYGYKN